MDTTTLQNSIANTKLAIEAYENALTALAAGNVQQYTIDTGQTRQTVTRLDLPAVNKALDGLYNRLSMLQQRLSGSGSIVRPGW